MGKPIIYDTAVGRIDNLFRKAWTIFPFRDHDYRLFVSEQAFRKVIESPAYITIDRSAYKLAHFWNPKLRGYINGATVEIDPTLGGTIIVLSVDDGVAVYTDDFEGVNF